MPRAPLFLALVFIALGGCQQAAWKAGASADDFKRDERACNEQSHDSIEVSQCLRSKGWSLANYAVESEDDESSVSTSPATTTESTSSPLTQNVRNPTNDSAQSSSTGSPKSEKIAAPANPLQRQSVQTWWKAGAQAADFQIDSDRCLAQLGEQHLPDYSKRLYTRAMVSCLREHGWYAGRDPVYTPLR